MCEPKVNNTVAVIAEPDNVKAIVLLAVFDVWKVVFPEI
jgi:hypothetical protein